MKRAFIFHCWEGVPEYCWYPWVKKQLEEKGYQVIVPEMPETELPKQRLWIPRMEEIIGIPDENTVLIGHSIGAVSILRYLEALQDERVGGVVMVAGFTDNLGFEELENYFEKPLDFAKIRQHCGRFVAIHSDDDPYVDLVHSQIFEKELGAEIFVKKGKKHFSGPVDDEESCLELPEVVVAVDRFGL